MVESYRTALANETPFYKGSESDTYRIPGVIPDLNEIVKMYKSPERYLHDKTVHQRFIERDGPARLYFMSDQIRFHDYEQVTTMEDLNAKGFSEANSHEIKKLSPLEEERVFLTTIYNFLLMEDDFIEVNMYPMDILKGGKGVFFKTTTDRTKTLAGVEMRFVDPGMFEIAHDEPYQTRKLYQRIHELIFGVYDEKDNKGLLSAFACAEVVKGSDGLQIVTSQNLADIGLQDWLNEVFNNPQTLEKAFLELHPYITAYIAYIKGQEEGRPQISADLFLRAFVQRYGFNTAHLVDVGRQLGYSLRELNDFLDHLND